MANVMFVLIHHPPPNQTINLAVLELSGLICTSIYFGTSSFLSMRNFSLLYYSFLTSLLPMEIIRSRKGFFLLSLSLNCFLFYRFLFLSLIPEEMVRFLLLYILPAKLFGVS